VPGLSRFYGIVIRMFAESGASHHLGHFHAFYQEHSATFGIDPLELIAGWRQRRLVEAWAELHQNELRVDWERLLSGEPALPIDPLRG